MKKTVFLKNGQSDILPKIKYGISGPQGDLLHWYLSRSFTFNILVHQEGSERRSGLHKRMDSDMLN